MAQPPVSRILLSRRRFIGCAGTALVAAPITGAFALSTGQRSVSFVHMHTGDRLSAVYFKGGDYDASGLSQVNQLLRDFRTGDVHPIEPQLLDILHDLQVLADRDAPYEVISGYRSPVTNDMLHNRSSGVAKRSLHMDGRAIDVRLPGFSTRKLRELALSMQRGGVGFYAKSDFVHLDTGRVRFWEG